MTNKINEIKSKVDCQENRTPASANNVPQKQDTVTFSAGPSKIKDLKESKKLLELQKKMKQLLNSWAKGLTYDMDYGTIGPINLKTGSDSEIIKSLRGEYTTEIAITERKSAANVFPDISLHYCRSSNSYEKMREIAGLFKNSIFKKVVCVGEDLEAYGGSGDTSYLIGITKNNKMLGVYLSYSE